MFRRKRNRLPLDSYVKQRWYFMTLNAEGRQQIFSDERVVNAVLATPKAGCTKHRFDIYAYCFMPDHIHLEAVGLASTSSLPEFMRTWKGTSAVPPRESVSAWWDKRSATRWRDKPAAPRWRDEPAATEVEAALGRHWHLGAINAPLLQKGYWDHVLRAADNHDAVAWYIFNNPVRKGLVNDPREWPYSGSWMLD
jgi:putative transposase